VERETKRTFPDQVHCHTTFNTPSTDRRKEPRLRSSERLIQGRQSIIRLLRRLFNSRARPCIVETHWTCGHMRTEIVREKAMITDHKGDNIRRNEGTPHPDISMSNVIRSAVRCQTRWPLARNGTTKTHRMARIACDAMTWMTGRLVNFRHSEGVGY
jgi:hypothetical protein